MNTTRRAAAPAVALLAAALLTTGCQGDVGESNGPVGFSAENLDEALEGLPGVDSAHVDYEALDFDYYDSWANVRMDEDASPEEIVHVLKFLDGAEIEVESEGKERTDPVRLSVVIPSPEGDETTRLCGNSDTLHSASHLVRIHEWAREAVPYASVSACAGLAPTVSVTVVVADEGEVAEATAAADEAYDLKEAHVTVTTEED